MHTHHDITASAFGSFETRFLLNSRPQLHLSASQLIGTMPFVAGRISGLSTHYTVTPRLCVSRLFLLTQSYALKNQTVPLTLHRSLDISLQFVAAGHFSWTIIHQEVTASQDFEKTHLLDACKHDGQQVQTVEH